ncbi:MAG: DUF4344 domain-containing metallopeptidase [Rhodothermales bacterium]
MKAPIPTFARALVAAVLCSLTLLSSAVAQSFELVYEEPAPGAEGAAELVIRSSVFDEVIEDLETLFALPHPVVIRFTSSQEGPYYLQGEVVLPYEFIVQNDQFFAAVGYSETVEEQQVALLQLTEFVLHHEVGHALIDMLDLPVLGKEEDAVDGFAAVIASHLDLDEVALTAAASFSILSQMSEEFSLAQFWDTHSLDEQRMFSIICLIYGSHPEKHAELLGAVGMPAEEGPRCQQDYVQTARSWSRVLGDYLKN